MEMTVTDNEVAEGLAPRVGPLDGVRQTFSLAWRTLVQIKHNPAELIDFSIQPVMFLLLFTYVFGGAIGGSPHKYLMFALPGIIVQNSLFTTLNTATGLSTDLEKGFFDRLRSLPIARFAPLAGRIMADIAKQAWAVAMLLAIGAILGFRIGTNPLAVLAAVGLILVSTLALSWALVLVAMLAANPEKVQIFGFVVLFPITFTSDAFVRTASMPGWLQAWSKANPVSLISDAMRGLMVSGPVTRPLVESLLYAVAFTAVFAPLAVRAFRRRV
jgi:ABC transporter DrrB family efflux protein